MPGEKVYLDTSSINCLYENFGNRSKKIFKDYEIYLSGSHLDEIIQISSVVRTQEIFKFLWSISNRIVLKDKRKLVEMEVSSLLSHIELNIEDYFYPKHEVYISAFKDLRKGVLGDKSKLALSKIKDKKKISFDQTKRRRVEWQSHFDGNRLPDSWDELFHVLRERRSFNRTLFIDLKGNNVIKIYKKKHIMDLIYENLVCTSIGLEYFFAFRFVTESMPRRYGKPTPGEIYDNTHVYYAGLVDIFVTDDERMKYIMRDLLHINRPLIISSEEFVSIAQK